MPREALNKERNVQLFPEVLEYKDFIFFEKTFSITALVGHALFAREVIAFKERIDCLYLTVLTLLTNHFSIPLGSGSQTDVKGNPSLAAFKKKKKKGQRLSECSLKNLIQ